MSIASPDWAPSARWDWLNRTITARRLLMLALFFGLSLAAAASLNVDCRDQPNYLLAESGSPIMLEDGSGFLLVEEKRRACSLAAGKVLTLTF